MGCTLVLLVCVSNKKSLDRLNLIRNNYFYNTLFNDKLIVALVQKI